MQTSNLAICLGIYINVCYMLTQIAKAASLQFSTDSVDPKPKAGPATPPEETEPSVINFFMRDDKSCQAHGKRDTIVVKSNG